MDQQDAMIHARLDQLSAAARDGTKVEVSDKDLKLLVTFAFVGIFAIGTHDNDDVLGRARCSDRVRNLYGAICELPTALGLPPLSENDNSTIATELASACAASIRDRFMAYMLVKIP